MSSVNNSICKIPYECAVGYTTVGCNESAFLGSITGSNSKIRFLCSMETVFDKKAKLIEHTASFDEFFDIFKKELFSDLDRACKYDNFYNKQRAKDINYISSLFFNDCIENAKSPTQGGVTFSGGECMLWADFLEETLKACKENGIHTAVDTAGHVPY